MENEPFPKIRRAITPTKAAGAIGDLYPPMYDISTFGIGMFDSVRCSE